MATLADHPDVFIRIANDPQTDMDALLFFVDKSPLAGIYMIRLRDFRPEEIEMLAKLSCQGAVQDGAAICAAAETLRMFPGYLPDQYDASRYDSQIRDALKCLFHAAETSEAKRCVAQDYGRFVGYMPTSERDWGVSLGSSEIEREFGRMVSWSESLDEDK